MKWASLMAQLVKNLPANTGDIGEVGSTPGLGRSPGVGNGNPLQNSCLENPMDRGDLQAIVRGVAKSQRTERLSTHARIFWYANVKALSPNTVAF